VSGIKDHADNAKYLGEIPTGYPNGGGANRYKSAIFEKYLAISQKRCTIGT